MSDVAARLAKALEGRYRVERELGQGGMATVYLAEDLKHKRRVAVKLLKPELAAVLGAERFLQEITTTASLQHPHILPLFDSGSADGFLFYVMPFIDGETLRDKLNRESLLPVDEAIRIATEVADALDYAHRQGVIHRDIKPENILLHDGRPMVADFGIALALSAAAGGRMTETGLSLGTPHYMSPEQATAEKELSARSDVYSLGSVLYEMLTGNPPHVGATAQQIIMKIVTEEAAPVTSVRKSVPPHVAAAVAQSLQKLPADRFVSAAAFSEALHNPSFGAGVGTTTLVGPARRGSLVAWGVAAVAVVVAGAMLLRPRGGGSADEQVVSATIELPTDVELDNPQIRFSADGSRFFVTVRRNGVQYAMERPLDAADARVVPGTEDGQIPFASPDGQWLFFGAVSGGLSKVPLAGGPTVVLAPTTASTGGDVGADGTVYYSRDYQSGVWRLRPDNSQPEAVTTPDSVTGELGHWSPRLLPGGRQVIYTAFRVPIDSSRIEVVSLETGQRKVVLVGGVFPSVVGKYLFYARNEVLLAAPFDLRKLQVSGPSVAVLDDLAMRSQDGVAGYAVSGRGTLIYLSASEYDAPADLVWVDRQGRDTPALPESGRYHEPAIAPEGRRIALTVTAKGETADVWVYDLVRGTRTRLTSGGGIDFGSGWSPDGKTVHYQSERPVFDLYSRAADASGPVTPLVADGEDKSDAGFTPDGQFMVFSRFVALEWQIWWALADGTNPELLLKTAGDNVSGPAISPDGRWMAFHSGELGRSEVHVVPYPEVTGARQAVSNAGGSEARWTRAGRELVWRNGADFVSASFNPTTGEAGHPTTLFSGRDYLFSPRQTRNWDVTPDGERFLLIRRPAERAPRKIRIVTNWMAQLERQMPSATNP